MTCTYVIIVSYGGAGFATWSLHWAVGFLTNIKGMLIKNHVVDVYGKPVSCSLRIDVDKNDGSTANSTFGTVHCLFEVIYE